MSAVLRLDVALERIGDYASTIGREIIQLSGRPPERIVRDVQILVYCVVRILVFPAVGPIYEVWVRHTESGSESRLNHPCQNGSQMPN